jgi:hypothetical protein
MLLPHSKRQWIVFNRAAAAGGFPSYEAFGTAYRRGPPPPASGQKQMMLAGSIRPTAAPRACRCIAASGSDSV